METNYEDGLYVLVNANGEEQNVMVGDGMLFQVAQGPYICEVKDLDAMTEFLYPLHY